MPSVMVIKTLCGLIRHSCPFKSPTLEGVTACSSVTAVSTTVLAVSALPRLPLLHSIAHISKLLHTSASCCVAWRTEQHVMSLALPLTTRLALLCGSP